MNISSLRRAFKAAMWDRDAETILDILDRLYYAEEFDFHEDWKKEVQPLLNEIQEEEKEFINTETLEYIK